MPPAGPGDQIIPPCPVVSGCVCLQEEASGGTDPLGLGGKSQLLAQYNLFATEALAVRPTAEAPPLCDMRTASEDGEQGLT
jgi:hypothetical protein